MERTLLTPREQINNTWEESMSRTRSLLRWAALSLLGATLTEPAQAYPDKPIRLVVSIAAGSVTDVIMRAAANELNARLGQPLIIENKGGASGILGAQTCAQAAPDGYTLCVIYHSTMSYNPLLFDKLPYDADADFIPVTRLFLLSEGLFVSSKVGVNSVAELRTLAQTKSHSLNFATLGEGSFPDLFRVWLNNQWNTGMVGVPYKGGGPAAQALLAGEVELNSLRNRQFHGRFGDWKGEGACCSHRAAVASAPERPDIRRSRSELFRTRVVGSCGSEGDATRCRRQVE